MNENVDLTKILKDCPKGWKFWSPIFGEVEFEKIFKHREFVNVKKDKDSWSFCSDATFPIGDIKSIEIMLYPSEDQRDWSKFTAPWYKKKEKKGFDPKTLQPFEKALIRRGSENYNVWFPDFVSDPPNGANNKTLCMCVMEDIAMVIPYNDETKHLLGTTDEAPEYYRYWEE